MDAFLKALFYWTPFPNAYLEGKREGVIGLLFIAKILDAFLKALFYWTPFPSAYLEGKRERG